MESRRCNRPFSLANSGYAEQFATRTQSPPCLLVPLRSRPNILSGCQQTVRQRALSVINVGDDGEAARPLQRNCGVPLYQSCNAGRVSFRNLEQVHRGPCGCSGIRGRRIRRPRATREKAGARAAATYSAGCGAQWWRPSTKTAQQTLMPKRGVGEHSRFLVGTKWVGGSSVANRSCTQGGNLISSETFPPYDVIFSLLNPPTTPGSAPKPHHYHHHDLRTNSFSANVAQAAFSEYHTPIP